MSGVRRHGEGGHRVSVCIDFLDKGHRRGVPVTDRIILAGGNEIISVFTPCEAGGGFVRQGAAGFLQVAVGDLPDSDVAIISRACEAPAVWRKSDGVYGVLIALYALNEVQIVRVPDFDVSILSGTDKGMSVRQPCQAGNGFVVPHDGANEVSIGFPYLNQSVRAAGRQNIAPRVPRQGSHGVVVGVHGDKQLVGLSVPYLHDAIRIARSQKIAVRRKRDAGDGGIVTLECVLQRTIRRAPQLHRFILGTGVEELAVRGEKHAGDGAVMGEEILRLLARTIPYGDGVIRIPCCDYGKIVQIQTIGGSDNNEQDSNYRDQRRSFEHWVH